MFWLCKMAKIYNGKEIYKKVCCRCKFVFLGIRSVDFVAVLIAVVVYHYTLVFFCL